jgi:hypothetical protein
MKLTSLLIFFSFFLPYYSFASLNAEQAQFEILESFADVENSMERTRNKIALVKLIAENNTEPKKKKSKTYKDPLRRYQGPSLEQRANRINRKVLNFNYRARKMLASLEKKIGSGLSINNAKIERLRDEAFYHESQIDLVLEDLGLEHYIYDLDPVVEYL